MDSCQSFCFDCVGHRSIWVDPGIRYKAEPVHIKRRIGFNKLDMTDGNPILGVAQTYLTLLS